MSVIYTTRELLEILEEEYRACVKGQRLNLTASSVGVNPVIDQFLNTEGLQKFTAYQDFRATIHQYQQEHRVSGLVWREVVLHGQSLRYPEAHEQLVTLPEDLVTLREYRDRVVCFWQDCTSNMDLYLAVGRGEYRSLETSEVFGVVERTQWASLCYHQYRDMLEVVLQLGWGTPQEALSWRGWPQSGSEFIYAVPSGCQPVTAFR